MDIRAIPGQPGYLCSRDGRVFSTKRGGQREMSLFARGRQGHLGVNLTHEGRYRLHSVHVLIALTWLGPRPSPLHVVMHGDNNPLNNADWNLSWGLPMENSAQMVRHQRQARGERSPHSRLTSDGVLEIKRRIARGDKQRDIANAFQVAATTITDIKRGRTWRHVGA